MATLVFSMTMRDDPGCINSQPCLFRIGKLNPMPRVEVDTLCMFRISAITLQCSVDGMFLDTSMSFSIPNALFPVPVHISRTLSLSTRTFQPLVFMANLFSF